MLAERATRSVASIIKGSAGFFCAKPKNPVRDFQKPSSANFAETQLFSKNPVLKMAKLRFSEICRKDQQFFSYLFRYLPGFWQFLPLLTHK